MHTHTAVVQVSLATKALQAAGIGVEETGGVDGQREKDEAKSIETRFLKVKRRLERGTEEGGANANE
jgi:hypothetical protein